jgi:hypothetical protein
VLAARAVAGEALGAADVVTRCTALVEGGVPAASDRAAALVATERDAVEVPVEEAVDEAVAMLAADADVAGAIVTGVGVSGTG